MNNKIRCKPKSSSKNRTGHSARLHTGILFLYHGIPGDFCCEASDLYSGIFRRATPASQFGFPIKNIGKQKIACSFQPKWYKSWSWMLCNEERDVVHCHTCVRALAIHKTMAGCIDAQIRKMPLPASESIPPACVTRKQ